MINSIVKLIAIDNFYSQEEAKRLSSITYNLQYEQAEFGSEVKNFNMVSPEFSGQLAELLNTNIKVDEDNSGIFRIPDQFIHFEPFDSLNDWIFVVALQESIFNLYEHETGTQNALENYKYNYRNLFEWKLITSHILQPGHGVLFRPWLFHSFDSGQIQIFRLREKDANIL